MLEYLFIFEKVENTVLVFLFKITKAIDIPTQSFLTSFHSNPSQQPCGFFGVLRTESKLIITYTPIPWVQYMFYYNMRWENLRLRWLSASTLPLILSLSIRYLQNYKLHAYKNCAFLLFLNRIKIKNDLKKLSIGLLFQHKSSQSGP